MLGTPESSRPPLASQAHDPRDETIATLVRRLIDDGKAYARAEFEVAKQIARHRAGRVKTGGALLGIGVVLLLCALQALVLALVLGLATLIGPLGAGLVVFAALALAGYLAVKAGVKALSGITGDAGETAALARGEVG